METTQEPQRILLVGTERNCRSIGYVLDFKDYELIEKLTTENYAQYQDYQIYVCELKRKSKKLLDRKLLKTVNDIQYLDDICRKIDEEWLNAKTKSVNNLSLNADKTCAVKQQAIKEENKNTKSEKPLIKNIKRCVKYPLRIARCVISRLKKAIKKMIKSLKYFIKNKYKKDIKNYLNNLSASGLLLYVLRAPINSQIKCTIIENNVRVYRDGKIRACCSTMVPFGSLLMEGNANEIYNSIYARIVKLSSLNQTYCLCALNRWCHGYCETKFVQSTKDSWNTPKIPQALGLSYDATCNLVCKSCRKEFYVMDSNTQQRAILITEKLLNSGWCEQTKHLQIAGNGEVFYSPCYRKLIITDLSRENITILSNGILFNESNWQLIANKYKKIDVEISVDAATAETYRKLRGADFNILTKNLTMLGELRRRKKINFFQINFVVQRENFVEMPDFIELGRTLSVDKIQFQRLNSRAHINDKEFNKLCLIINNEYLDYELWKVLQNPIFNDPIVDLKGLQRYIDASEKKYRKRYESECKSHTA